MSKKTNIRSIRFSDEIADLIDRQQGRNFSEKFENLVVKCAWEVPAAEQRLQDAYNEYNKIEESTEGLIRTMNKLQRMTQTAMDNLTEINRIIESQKRQL